MSAPWCAPAGPCNACHFASTFTNSQHGSLSSSQLSEHPDRDRLCRDRLSPGRCEDHFIWLIQLGVLRREVDGQGLTERVRLTPLGRDVLAEWTCEIPPAKPWQRLRHWARRQRPRL